MTIRHTTCPLCEALCGLEIELDGDRVTSIRGNEADPLSQGHICPKAIALQDLHDDPDRLRRPVRRDGSRWVPVTWEDALEEAAERLSTIQKEHGNDALAMYTGNPAAHNYSILLSFGDLNGAISSYNRYSATSADQLPHMFAALQMFGHQLLLPVPDVDRTELFVVFGANPAASNGSIMTAPGIVDRMKAIRERGGRVILFDPRRTETAKIVDEHHFVKPGTDALLLFAILHTLFEKDWIAPGDWHNYSKGLDHLRNAAQGFTAKVVSPVCGVSADVIVETARAMHEAGATAVYGRMGVATQRFGGLCAWLLYAINVVTGNLDQPGGIMFTSPAVDLVKLASLTGQKGHFAKGHSRVSKRAEFNGEYPVSVLAEEIETEGAGQIKGLITMAGNPVLSIPNGARLDGALGDLDFMVSIDPFINATTRHANLILPPVSPLERDHFGLAFHALAVRNTVGYHGPVIAPPRDGRQDWDIATDLGCRIASRRGGDRKSLRRLRTVRRIGPRRILDLALKMGKHGAWRHPFSGLRLSLRKLLDTPAGVDLGPLEPVLPDRLATEDKTIDLAPEVLLEDVDRLRQELLSATADTNPLLLIGRRHLRSCNSWLGNSERLVRGKNRCTLLMHPDDAEARSLNDGDDVEVRSRVGKVTVPLQLDDGIMPGVVSLPHGWGHARPGVMLSVAQSYPGVSINDITDEQHIDELTGNSGFSGVPVEVQASPATT